MTTKMLKKLGASFRESIKDSLELGDIMQKHISSLKKIKANDEDSKQLSLYLKQLELSYKERQKTQQITDFLDGIVSTMFHYAQFLNENSKEDEQIYLTISSRRKSLVSELRKIMRDIMLGKSGSIKDRFALRYIIENDGDEAENIELLYKITNNFIELLCYETNVRIEFLDWCAKNVPDELDQIKQTLSIQFVLFDADQPKDTCCRFNGDVDNPPQNLRFLTSEQRKLVIPNYCGIDPAYQFGVKDYVYDPKKRGYQSLHFILYIPATSPVLPGLFIEFQGRTRMMDVNAEDPNSPAYHGFYKENSIDEKIINTFKVDPKDVELKGFDFRPAPKPTQKQIETGKIPKDYLKDRAGLITAVFTKTRSILSSPKKSA